MPGWSPPRCQLKASNENTWEWPSAQLDSGCVGGLRVGSEMRFAYLVILWGCVALAMACVAVEALADWRGIPVEPESECSPYEDGDYSYDRERIAMAWWVHVGVFVSPYDAQIHAYEDVDLEHRVARHQAHVSGLCKRPKAERRRFAKDPLNITWATPRMNRVEKGDKDAAGWLPPKNRCHFAALVAQVKCLWGLSVDEAEAEALEGVLSGCARVKFQCVEGTPKEEFET